MIYLFLFALLLVCIATATGWAGKQERRLADIAMAWEDEAARDRAQANLPSLAALEAFADRYPPPLDWYNERPDDEL